jgi:urease accessory protein
MKKLLALAAAAAALAPTLAQAHTGLHTDGFGAGLAHPFSGLDHLLAMTAVGFWAATLGERARWAVPAAFVGVMTLGAILGAHGVALPAVEEGIAASVVALGLLIAFEVKIPAPAAALVVGLFAIFHGHAHGAEMPAMASPLVYGLGFVLATATLHAVGIGFGAVRARLGGDLVSRVAGAAIALSGVYIAFSG